MYRLHYSVKFTGISSAINYNLGVTKLNGKCITLSAGQQDFLSLYLQKVLRKSEQPDCLRICKTLLQRKFAHGEMYHGI